MPCIIFRPSDEGERRHGGKTQPLPHTDTHTHRHTHFFLNRTLLGMFSWKLTFVSFSKAFKTFLAPALPDSRRGPCYIYFQNTSEVNFLSF